MPYTSIYAKSGGSSSGGKNYADDFVRGKYAAQNTPAASVASKVVQAQSKSNTATVSKPSRASRIIHAVGNIANHDIAQPIVNLGSKVANEGVALAQLVQPTRASIDTREAQATRTLKPGGGLGHQGGVVENKSTPLTAKDYEKIAGTGAEIAALRLPGAKLAKDSKLVTRTIKTGATTAPSGGLFQGGQAASSGASAKEVAKQTGIGAIEGLVLGTAGSVVAPGVKKITGRTGIPQTKELVTNSKTQLALQALNEQKGKLKSLKASHPNQPAVDKAISAVDSKTAEVQKAGDTASAEYKKLAAKNTAETTKVSQQLDLLEAKAKDSGGKLSNVDKTKRQQLLERQAELSNTPKVAVDQIQQHIGKAQEQLSQAGNEKMAYRAGTIGDFISDPALRKDYAKVLDTPVLIKRAEEVNRDTKTGANVSGSLSTDAAGKSYIVLSDGIPANKIANVLVEEMTHATQWSRGKRPVEGVPYKQIPEEMRAKAAAEHHAPVKPPKITTSPTVGTPKLAERVRKDAIRKKMIYGFDKTFNDLPDYDKVSRKEQFNKATDLVLNDPETAMKVAMGEQSAPKGILNNSVWMAMKEYAENTRDVELMRQLAQSDLVTRATGMGQEISMLADSNPTSATLGIKQVADARKAAFEKRTGKSADEAVSAEVKAIRAAKPRTTKTDWSMFVESIKC